jgi:Glycosyltransferase family 9 (heptosyltransferase)
VRSLVCHGSPGPPCRIADFADTMAIIEGLDLVVTIDTAVGHLAGAMGRPVWLMPPFAPDCRWLLGRADSLVPDRAPVPAAGSAPMGSAHRRDVGGIAASPTFR